MGFDSSTVFRFVTVRGPRKPTGKETQVSFVDYDSKIKAPVVEEFRTKDRKEAIEFARRYKASKDFALSPSDINERQAGLLNFGDWLRAEGHRLTHEELRKAQARAALEPKA